MGCRAHTAGDGLAGPPEAGSLGTTTANTWAGLALRQFSQRYEREAVTGNTTALLGTATQTVHWNAARCSGRG